MVKKYRYQVRKRLPVPVGRLKWCSVTRYHVRFCKLRLLTLDQPSWKTHEFSMKNSYRKLPTWDILTMWYFKKSILSNACAWRPPLKGVDLQLNNQLNTMFCSHPLKLFKYDDFYHVGTFWQTVIVTSSLNHYSAKWLKCINDLNLLYRNNTEKKILRN